MLSGIFDFIRRRWMIFVAVFILLLSVSGIGLWHLNKPAGDGTKKVDFVIKPGWGAYAVTTNLYRERLIRSRTAFRIMLKIKGRINNLKMGIYTLNDGMTVSEIIDVLSSGKTKTITITIPEGLNNRQLGDRLAERGIFRSREEFLKYAESRELRNKYEIPGQDLEGYLFPDTYVFPVGHPKEAIIEAMVAHFFEKTADIDGFPKDPVKRHNLVILASIVEGEAKRKEERPVIAGVFVNRLKMNYPLESCATIQYTLKKHRERIFYNDLERDHPYNTYKNRGLPPGPISNPGLSCIKHSLNPAKTEYTFFVLKGDGYHQFSSNYKDHLRAKKEFLGE